ncbi:hypothetical protein K470DRAFT_271017 [Piedraia hortae CBS 480.64]|uniref:Phospholipid/glycerol acyltransferase domain-containing protein n=1 Tax=Piedraia hortae CBS 480.64 TaxID=1314780 RepID=A0A6A7BZK5_9PEZI|nr:hypothetical protein K470DRAFT_271017 [Piedraia hortae CBS 480.64]
MTLSSNRTVQAVVYDVCLWCLTIVVDLFFREIHPRSTWRIPRDKPVIFVAAPHANQFVDPLILMRVVRQDAKRRISFLIAEKSMRRKFIGFAAALVGSVPVGRALDNTRPANGTIYLPDPDGDATLVKGKDVDFENGEFMHGGLLVLPSVNNSAANSEIDSVIDSTSIRLKKPFKGSVAMKQLSEGTTFRVAPHVDQSQVYDQVFQKLREGGCIGIFPEGGSHDRTELLPLKAGLAIMALGALAEDPNCGVTIVPVGMNYFHPNKFRSRAVIEFGPPIGIDPKLVEQYKSGNKRGAVQSVLDTVYERLTAVTVLAPDYDTLMLIQAVRRLYNPKARKLPLPTVVELSRRLIRGYTAYKDDPRIVKLRADVLDYNRTLFRLNIRDHQVSYAKFTWPQVVVTLLYRVAKLSVLLLASLPGFVLFAPVFIAGKLISRKKSKEALAASTVKVEAKDVVATWKILVSLALTPVLDLFYTTLLVWWTYRNRVCGLVPASWSLSFVAAVGIFLFPAICFAALRFGEVGMDIFKSLPPLVLSINPTSANTLSKLRVRRENLSEQVNDIVNELGPELFPDFEKQRIVPDYTGREYRKPDSSVEDMVHVSPPTPTDSHAPNKMAQAQELPRNESLENLKHVAIFSTRPGTPNRSRSRTNSTEFKLGSGFGMMSISTGAESKANLDEVSKSLRAAMRERGKRKQDL